MDEKAQDLDTSTNTLGGESDILSLDDDVYNMFDQEGNLGLDFDSEKSTKKESSEAKNSAPGWHSLEDDKPHRQKMTFEIARLLQSRKKGNPAPEWMHQLPHKARKLEGRLYRNATSLDAYLDRVTLKNRLKLLARSIVQEYKEVPSTFNPTKRKRDSDDLERRRTVAQKLEQDIRNNMVRQQAMVQRLQDTPASTTTTTNAKPQPISSGTDANSLSGSMQSINSSTTPSSAPSNVPIPATNVNANASLTPAAFASSGSLLTNPQQFAATQQMQQRLSATGTTMQAGATTMQQRLSGTGATMQQRLSATAAALSPGLNGVGTGLQQRLSGTTETIPQLANLGMGNQMQSLNPLQVQAALARRNSQQLLNPMFSQRLQQQQQQLPQMAMTGSNVGMMNTTASMGGVNPLLGAAMGGMNPSMTDTMNLLQQQQQMNNNMAAASAAVGQMGMGMNGASMMLKNGMGMTGSVPGPAGVPDLATQTAQLQMLRQSLMNSNPAVPASAPSPTNQTTNQSYASPGDAPLSPGSFNW